MDLRVSVLVTSGTFSGGYFRTGRLHRHACIYLLQAVSCRYVPFLGKGGDWQLRTECTCIRGIFLGEYTHKENAYKYVLPPRCLFGKKQWLCKFLLRRFIISFFREMWSIYSSSETTSVAPLFFGTNHHRKAYRGTNWKVEPFSPGRLTPRSRSPYECDCTAYAKLDLYMPILGTEVPHPTGVPPLWFISFDSSLSFFYVRKKRSHKRLSTGFGDRSLPFVSFYSRDAQGRMRGWTVRVRCCWTQLDGVERDRKR